MLKNILSTLHRLCLQRRACVKEFLRWKKLGIDFAHPRLYYGHDSIPQPDEKASGGIIKCQDLQRRYRNNIFNANIVYLVSSALPDFSQYLISNAQKRGAKLVWNQNGVAYPAWHGPGWEKTNKPLVNGLHLADHVIFQSNFCKLASDRFLGEYLGPHTILYNPVNTSEFSPSFNKPAGHKILVAGTHNEWYRLRVALEAFKELTTKLPEAELLIAGPLRWGKNQNVAKTEADSFCRELCIERQVLFLGPYSQAEAIKIFQSAHILLHTQYNDACPRLVVEAMACGLPVVYSSTGGTPELVGDVAGIGIEGPVDWYRVHPPDPVQLASAVLQVFNEYHQYSRAARQRAVEQFDVCSWLDAHNEIFHSML